MTEKLLDIKLHWDKYHSLEKGGLEFIFGEIKPTLKQTHFSKEGTGIKFGKGEMK